MPLSEELVRVAVTGALDALRNQLIEALAASDIRERVQAVIDDIAAKRAAVSAEIDAWVAAQQPQPTQQPATEA